MTATHTHAHRWMEGWLDGGWTERWARDEGWMDDGWIEGWKRGEGWMERREAWMDRVMDEK